MRNDAFIRYLLALAAAYLFVIGLALLLVPVQFGVEAVPDDASPALVAFLRLMAGPFLGVAVLNWLSRAADHAVKLRPVIVANLLGFAVAAGNDIAGVITGDARDLARVFLVVHVAFTAAFLGAWRRATGHGGAR